jgi:hypothetical protein
VVSARIFYGFWRGWQAWQTTSDTATWLAQSGARGSMAAGAAVLGYYLAYWIGLRWRLNRVMRERSLWRGISTPPPPGGRRR